MLVALVNPPQVFSRYQVAAGITPPLGIAYLAGYLLEAGVEVVVVDALGEAPAAVSPFRDDALLRGLDLDQTVARIPEEADLVGISNLFTFAWPVVEAIAERVKARWPDRPVVVGGHHPSALPEQCLTRCAAIDFVVIGEGEAPLAELCAALGAGGGDERLGALEAVAWRRQDGHVRWTPQSRTLIKDIESIPFPARHLLPMEAYVTTQEAHGPVAARWTSILSSRGCPYGCTFCQSRLTRWRARSASNVVDEIEQCVERWGIREFHFEDDNMTIDRKRIVAIGEELARRGLEIRWQTPNGIRASVTDRATLQAMYDSGCRHVTLAPESGSERVLREVVRKGKDFELGHLLRVAEDAHAIGMKVAAYFILGLPGETEAEAEESIAYMRELARAGVDEVGIALFTPLPGTPLWDDLGERTAQMDYLDLLAIEDLKTAVSFNDNLDEADLFRLRRKAYALFFLTRARHHPRGLAQTLVNVLRDRQELKTDRVLLSLLKRARDGTGGEKPTVMAYPYDAARTIRVLLDSESSYSFKHSFRKALRSLRKRGGGAPVG